MSDNESPKNLVKENSLVKGMIAGR
jgi:hypothetical protein